MRNLLDEIIPSCKKVKNCSKFVKINYKQLDKMISQLELANMKYWLDTNPFDILKLDSRELINFLLVYHTIGDYCFWGEPKWQISTEYGMLDGSYAMMYLLLTKYDSFCRDDLSFLEFRELLKGNVEIPLLKNRYDNLVMMKQFLENSRVDFYTLISNISDDKRLFTFIIDNLPYFTDECDYNNERVYFYKRAQLLVSDILHIREKKELMHVDYRNLVGCADYKIPQVMRCYGILEFDEELSNLIDKKVELDSESLMEVEIRANTLVVIDYIANKLDNKISRMDINDYIWLLGQDKAKMKYMYHRTLTNNY